MNILPKNKLLKKMKSFLHKSLLLFAITTLIISCKKDDSDTNADPKAENRKALGLSAANILSADIYDKLTVEFVYSNGFRPQDASINAFRTFLENTINKPGGITFNETVINTPDNVPFTTDEINSIEDANRTKYTAGKNLAIYVFFANGSSTNDTNTSVTLGTAYQNTSMIVYEKTLMDLANRTINPAEALLYLESNTIHHEFGHILGLVNVQNDDVHPADHEDTMHAKHCVIENCLMYFESRNPLRIMQRITNRAPVPEFDDLCKADLRAKGGK